MNPQTDEQLEGLAYHYLTFNIQQEYGWTFDEFVQKYLKGAY